MIYRHTSTSKNPQKGIGKSPCGNYYKNMQQQVKAITARWQPEKGGKVTISIVFKIGVKIQRKSGRNNNRGAKCICAVPAKPRDTSKLQPNKHRYSEVYWDTLSAEEKAKLN